MTPPRNTEPGGTSGQRRVLRAALWLPGLLVALGAAVATAHGLYEVARAAENPPLIAGLYPLITDGLALVAYAATARLAGHGRRYAWGVVVLAAGLSGLAQASFLAQGVSAPPALRFGVGAWPAIAAAIVAHLLFLIATVDRPEGRGQSITTSEGQPSDPPPSDAEAPTVQLPPVQTEPVQPDLVRPVAVQPGAVQGPPPKPDAEPSAAPVQSRVRPIATRSVDSPARDRADIAARRHVSQHGALPTVTQLMELAQVSRGTAGEVLKTIRTHRAALHIVDADHDEEAHR